MPVHRNVIRVGVLALGVTCAAVAMLAGVPGALAQPSPAAQPAATLKPGDPAPVLKIAHWVKGEPVKQFEKGKVYVVEFWATWCIPCVQNIPKLTKLQSEHKGDLVVIGVSSSDQRGVEDVRPFVEKQGDAMAYTVAVDDAYATGRDYLDATGQRGIPVAYVVDKGGRLAWFGHPSNNMEGVVDMVLKGTFDPATYVDPQKKLAELDAKLRAAMTKKDAEEGERIFAELKTLRPELATRFDAGRVVFHYSSIGDKARAVALGEELLKTAMNDDAGNLPALASPIINDPEPGEKEIAFAKKVMDRCAELTSRKDPRMLTLLGDVYRKEKNFTKAIELNREAIATLTDTAAKRSFELKLQMIENELAASKAPPAPPAASPTDSQTPPVDPKR